MRLVPVLCLLLMTALPAPAAPVTLEEAVARARQEGRVLSAETRRDPAGRMVHRIRVLTPEGRVKRVRIPAGAPRKR